MSHSLRHSLARWLRSARGRLRQPESPARLFERIYHHRYWGRGDDGFYSGYGSHTAHYTDPYVAAVSAWLDAGGDRPVVVDLGCGDFAIGNRLVPCARTYIGCDVVEPLIARNRERFGRSGVQFERVDALTDALPHGDVVIVRHVLQHLSNAQIAMLLPRLRQYSRWLITEHVPAGDFTPNHDKPMDGYTRLLTGSGVDLTAPPFGVTPRLAERLCDVAADEGVMRTIAFTF